MNGSTKNKIAAVPEKLEASVSLCKVPVCILSSCAALMGYLAFDPRPLRLSLGTALGVLLLSAGSAALNNVQDRGIDRVMKRTSCRPLPAGRISPATGIAVSITALSAGMAVLTFSSVSYMAPATGAAAVLLYNGIYTPLKKRTGLALFPGIISGMLPPLIGWLAAGGPVSMRIVFIMTLFGVWQVPHFWLILMAHGDDYKKGGIPSLLERVPFPVLKMLVFIWVSVFSLMVLLIRPLSLVYTPVSTLIMLGIAVIIPFVFSIVLISTPKHAGYIFLFHLLNAAVLVLITTCVVDLFLVSFYFPAR